MGVGLEASPETEATAQRPIADFGLLTAEHGPVPEAAGRGRARGEGE